MAPDYRPLTVHFLPAIFAEAVNLKCVPGGGIVVLAADFLFELTDFLREKFDGTTASGADHVVMTATIVLVLVPRNAVVERDFAGQPAFGQQFQRAIHGCVADTGIFFLYQTVKFVGG